MNLLFMREWYKYWNYSAGTPKIYGYSVSGIKEDEKIINAGETRKVFISTRVPYTVEQQVLVDNLQYRLYVTQGTTQVEVSSLDIR